MAEERSRAFGGLEAERYQVELVPLATRSDAPSIVRLQE